MDDIAPPVNGRFGYPLGFAAGVLVTIVAVAAHGTSHPGVALAALTATAAMVAAVTALSAALASAAVTWGLHAGFVLGRRGELEFSEASAVAAVVLVTAAVVTYAVALAVRYLANAQVRVGMSRLGLLLLGLGGLCRGVGGSGAS